MSMIVLLASINLNILAVKIIFKACVVTLKMAILNSQVLGA
jgi:hypothetical protein